MNGSDRYSKILQLANHYENLSSSTELLIVISRIFLKKTFPIVNLRIRQLQQTIIIPLTPDFKEFKGVKEIFDLSTHKPKRKRPRQTNHGKNLQRKYDYVKHSNKIIEKRKNNPTTAEQMIPVSTEPHPLSGGEQQSDWWGCILS